MELSPKEILKTTRLLLQLSQKQMAETAGITLRTYQRYEAGKFSKAQSGHRPIKLIDEKLGINLYTLLYAGDTKDDKKSFHDNDKFSHANKTHVMTENSSQAAYVKFLERRNAIMETTTLELLTELRLLRKELAEVALNSTKMDQKLSSLQDQVQAEGKVLYQALGRIENKPDQVYTLEEDTIRIALLRTEKEKDRADGHK